MSHSRHSSGYYISGNKGFAEFDCDRHNIIHDNMIRVQAWAGLMRRYEGVHDESAYALCRLAAVGKCSNVVCV